MNCPVDFALLCDETAGYAVHCPTEEDADLFLEWARRLYPKMCEQWADGRNNYDSHGKDTVYTFDRHLREDKWEKSRLMYGSVTQVLDIGYTVIEFDEVYKQEELAEGDQPISLLIGGGE